jgi:hypothetical protein
MMAVVTWIADELPDEAWNAPDMEHGSCYADGPLSDLYPEVKRPIGFMRRKPRVRVKAWSMPIIPSDL